MPDDFDHDDKPLTSQNNLACQMCGAEVSVGMRECKKCGEPNKDYQKDDEKYGLWRDKQLLVAKKNATFPDRCLKTNKPAEGARYRQTFYWISGPTLLSFIGIGIIGVICMMLTFAKPLLGVMLLLPAVIVFFTIQQSASLTMGILPVQLSELRMKRLICRLLIFASLFIAVGLPGFFDRNREGLYCVFTGVVFMVISTIFYRFASRFMQRAKMTKEFIWIKGVHPNFLKKLPEWQGD